MLDNAVAGRETAKARLDQAKASLRMAEDKMGYTELHANFDAVVTAWNAVVGQYVDTGQATVTLARPDIREAVVDIPDELLDKGCAARVLEIHDYGGFVPREGIWGHDGIAAGRAVDA